MNKSLKIFVATSLMFASFSSYATLSDNYDKCMEQSYGVTANMLNCIAAEYDLQDKLLNKYYNQIMSALDNEAKAAFKKSQIAWLKWKEAEVDSTAKIFGDNINYNAVNLQIISNRVDSFASILGVEQTSNSSIIGTYNLNEDGRSGSLNINSEGMDYGVTIGSSTNMGDTCEYNGLCTLDGNKLSCEDPAPDTEQATVYIKIENGVATVETESSMYSCGLRNYLNGTYYKQ